MGALTPEVCPRSRPWRLKSELWIYMFASVFVAMEPLTPNLAAWVTVAMEQ